MQPEVMYDVCTEALSNFVHDTGFDEVVIGLSGGIDSSLVAAMAVDALGADNVHGILLPGPYSSESSITDALELANNLGMSTKTISIEEPYKAFAHVVSDAMGEALSGLAAENTQARCRMICLMAISNSKGWLMLNTGNKSEAAMGYSTLYGDTAGAFAPIGGLYKQDVYALCNWRNQYAISKGDTPPIPHNVIDKPPSAELSPNQSDEASMGIAYEDLDPILIGLVERGRQVEDLVDEGFDRNLVNMVARRYSSYAFKRALEPPYPDVAFYD